jgi:hypothetical protein
MTGNRDILIRNNKKLITMIEAAATSEAIIFTEQRKTKSMKYLNRIISSALSLFIRNSGISSLYYMKSVE